MPPPLPLASPPASSQSSPYPHAALPSRARRPVRKRTAVVSSLHAAASIIGIHGIQCDNARAGAPLHTTRSAGKAPWPGRMPWPGTFSKAPAAPAAAAAGRAAAGCGAGRRAGCRDHASLKDGAMICCCATTSAVPAVGGKHALACPGQVAAQGAPPRLTLKGIMASARAWRGSVAVLSTARCALGHQHAAPAAGAAPARPLHKG
jgi:hypothetical protein